MRIWPTAFISQKSETAPEPFHSADTDDTRRAPFGGTRWQLLTVNCQLLHSVGSKVRLSYDEDFRPVTEEQVVSLLNLAWGPPQAKQTAA